jgi:hypothetical protein
VVVASHRGCGGAGGAGHPRNVEHVRGIYCNGIEAPWLVTGGHGASLNATHVLDSSLYSGVMALQGPHQAAVK